MATDDLRELLTRDPFEPFRVRLTSGDSHEIRDPLSAAMMKSRLFIALPRSDKSVYVPFLHIAALETIGNGRKRAARSGRQRQAVAAVISMAHDEDWERLRMGYPPKLRAILLAARGRVRSGEGISSVQFWGEVARAGGEVGSFE